MTDELQAVAWDDESVNDGDIVIDSRGTLYVLLKTEPSIIKQRCHYGAKIVRHRGGGSAPYDVTAYENGRGEIIRVGLMFKLPSGLVPFTVRQAEPARRAYFESRAEKVRAKNRAAADANKKRTDDALRYVSGVRRYE